MITGIFTRFELVPMKDLNVERAPQNLTGKELEDYLSRFGTCFEACDEAEAQIYSIYATRWTAFDGKSDCDNELLADFPVNEKPKAEKLVRQLNKEARRALKRHALKRLVTFPQQFMALYVEQYYYPFPMFRLPYTINTPIYQMPSEAWNGFSEVISVRCDNSGNKVYFRSLIGEAHHYTVECGNHYPQGRLDVRIGEFKTRKEAQLFRTMLDGLFVEYIQRQETAFLLNLVETHYDAVDDIEGPAVQESYKELRKRLETELSVFGNRFINFLDMFLCIEGTCPAIHLLHQLYRLKDDISYYDIFTKMDCPELLRVGFLLENHTLDRAIELVQQGYGDEYLIYTPEELTEYEMDGKKFFVF